MKKFFMVITVLAIAGGVVWFMLRPPTSIKNKDVTYVISVEGGKRTQRDGAEAIAVTQGTATYTFTAGPADDLSSTDCPAVTPKKDRTITIEKTEVPLCLSPSGGIVLAPFVHDGRTHTVTMFSDGVPDYDLAAKVFETISVRD